MSFESRFIVIRHHLSEANLTKMLTNSRAIYLTKKDRDMELDGSATAVLQREKFKDFVSENYANAGPFRIIRSPTRRTDLTTADFTSVLPPGSFTVEIDEAFREKEFGIEWDSRDDPYRKRNNRKLFDAYMYDGMSPARQKIVRRRLRHEFGDQLGKFWIAPPGGESELMVQQRAIKRMREVARQTPPGETIVVVEHSVTKRVTIGGLENIPANEVVYQVKPQNSSIYEWTGRLIGDRFIGTGEEVFSGFPVPVTRQPAIRLLLSQGINILTNPLGAFERITDLTRPVFPRRRSLAH